MRSQPRCPHCRHFVDLDMMTCPNGAAELAYDFVTREQDALAFATGGERA